MYYNRGVIVEVLKIKVTVILTYDMKGAYKNVAKGKTIVVRAYRPHFSSLVGFWDVKRRRECRDLIG